MATKASSLAVKASMKVTKNGGNKQPKRIPSVKRLEKVLNLGNYCRDSKSN